MHFKTRKERRKIITMIKEKTLQEPEEEGSKDYKIVRFNLGNMGKGELWYFPINWTVRIWGKVKNGNKVKMEFVSDDEWVDQTMFRVATIFENSNGDLGLVLKDDGCGVSHITLYIKFSEESKKRNKD